jgi:hypothetical protein
MAQSHTHEHKGFIPPSQIGRPDFVRGTVGNDINPHAVSTLHAKVVDKTVRNEIGSNSKTAHFTLGH